MLILRVFFLFFILVSVVKPTAAQSFELTTSARTDSAAQPIADSIVDSIVDSSAALIANSEYVIKQNSVEQELDEQQAGQQDSASEYRAYQDTSENTGKRDAGHPREKQIMTRQEGDNRIKHNQEELDSLEVSAVDRSAGKDVFMEVDSFPVSALDEDFLVADSLVADSLVTDSLGTDSLGTDSLLTTFRAANPLSVRWGNYEKVANKAYGREIVHENEQYVYVIERESKNINFLFFQISKAPALVLSVYKAADLSPVKRNYLSFPSKGKVKHDYSFLKLIESENKLILFFRAQSKKTDAVKLLAQVLDKKGAQQGDIFELDQGMAIRASGLFKKAQLAKFGVQLSTDKKKIGIVKFSSVQEGERIKVGYKLLDSDFKVSWNGQVTLPYEKEFFDLSSYQIGDQGELILLGKAWKLERKVGVGGKGKTRVSKQGKADPNYAYQLIVFSTKNKLLTQVNLALKGNYVTDVAMHYLQGKNQVYLAGFYSEQWGGSIRGSFTKTIDLQQGEVVGDKKKKFSAQFLELFLSKRKIRKLREGESGDYELDNFRLDNFTVKKDGSAVLFAEEYFVQMNTSSMTDANGFVNTTTNYTYYYGDILVMYMSANGEVQWTAKIPKNQISFNDGGPFSSYLVDVEQDRLYMVFNDHPSNIRRLQDGDDVRKMGNPKSAVAVVVSIDNNGEMTRKELFSAKEADVVFRPKSSWYRRDQLRSSEIYLFGINYPLFSRGRFKLGVLSFEGE